MRKILFIAHYFPPIGGAGVQRTAKFVKYLPSFGFLPLVLTGVAKVNRWTPEDTSLLAEIPLSVPVYRAVDEVGEPGGFLSKAEGAKHRVSALIKLGSQIIAEHRPELIFVTMSPFDDAVVAAELARRHGLPWVADLRDPWALDEFQVHRTWCHRWQARRLMGHRLATARSIIMNTPEAARQFRAEFPALAGKAVVNITNGFDPIDLNVEPALMCPGKFNVVHSGYFHAELGLRQKRRAWEYRLLGRTQRGVKLLPRSHYYLVRALKQWLSNSPGVAEEVAVVCLGNASAADQCIVDEQELGSICTFAGYTPHAECLRYVLGADLLFLPMHSVGSGRRATIVPGKAYEYLAAGRPILAAIPNGDARDFIEQAGTGLVCGPSDVTAMVEILRCEYARWHDRRAGPSKNDEYLRRFERQLLARDLALELSRVLAEGGVRPVRS